MIQTIYDILKANGDEIKVEPKEGEGSGFIIQLMALPGIFGLPAGYRSANSKAIMIRRLKTIAGPSSKEGDCSKFAN